MEGLPRPSKPMENRMSKTTAEILNQSYGLIGEANHTFGEALDHYAVVIGNATAVPKAKQESLIEASLFLASLRSQFLTDKEWGKFLKGTAIFKKLKLRFGSKNAAPEASKMLWIGAVDAKHLNGFKEANGSRPTKGLPFFRCDSTSPTGLVQGINRYLVEVVGLQGEALLEASAMSTVGRAKKIEALKEPKQPKAEQQPKAEKPVASDPKDQATDQVEDQPKAEQQPKAESTTPVQPKAEKPTAEAVVEQLASQVEAYGFDGKDIENVLRLLTERLQPKVVQTIGKAKPKKAASKKQAAAKKAA